MKPAVSIVTSGIVLMLSLAPAMAATGVAPANTSAVTPPEANKASGASLYGQYLMRHSVSPDGSAAAHFSPPLPVDNRLLIGAMKSLARIAYGQNAIEVKDVDAFKPSFGKVIKLADWDYEYRFLLDGAQSKGIDVILVSRQEVKHPIPSPIPTPIPVAAPVAEPQPH